VIFTEKALIANQLFKKRNFQGPVAVWMSEGQNSDLITVK
jgi:hypothetical protein